MTEIYKLDPYAYTYYHNSEKPQNIKMALASREVAKTSIINIDQKNYMCSASARAENSAIYYNYGSGLDSLPDKIKSNCENHPEIADELKKIYDAIEPDLIKNVVPRARDTYENKLERLGACWGGGWAGHSNPDYDRLLHLGTNGIRKLIAQYKQINDDKADFYEGCEIMLDAIDILGDRVRELALKEAEEAADTGARKEYEAIAKVFEVIPREPAYDMRSAIQLFWLVFTFDGVDSPGRLDQFMIDYWRATDDKDEARLLFERMWDAFHNTRTWNLCISGSDENWNDMSNELTYVVLDCCEKFRFNTPNVTLRVHRNTPDKIWKRAAESIATGIGLPAIYNDEVVCPALEKMGIPPYHSHLYCMNGCNQIDIMGKSHMGLEDGEVNFGKCLEYTLHDGFDTKHNTFASIHTGNAAHFKSFDELMQAFYRQVDYITDVATSLSVSSQRSYALYSPSPLRSCLIEGCLEKGRDYKDGGPLYGDGQILSEGMPDCVDSLIALKKFVFEEKRYTMAEIVAALRNNFEGYEEMRAVLKTAPHFGNDDPYVDTLMKEISDHWFAYLKTKSTFRGGRFAGGCSTFRRAANNGLACGALPNGLLEEESIFADSIGATPGRDVSGPTAAVKSALVYDQTEVASGFVFQLRFDKKLFATPKGMESFINLAKTYFAGGGQQLSINVLSAEDLIEAQKHPENYGDLVVRVGGYSDYFTSLKKPMQDNIIARTIY
ncbi:MAG: hypothetical protein E7672_00805 [Ruminococcaceae bacterium]|nr:hypothetical protein [Oscillospiraceae bacterium]